MTSSLSATKDYYLLIIPAVFGFVFAFVFGIAIYQCATFSRVKATYKKRNRILIKRLAHCLDFCERNGVPYADGILHDMGYNDIGDKVKKTLEKVKKRKSNGSNDYDFDDAASRGSVAAPSRSASQRRQPQHTGRRSSSFVLEEVSMLDSDGESN